MNSYFHALTIYTGILQKFAFATQPIIRCEPVSHKMRVFYSESQRKFSGKMPIAHPNFAIIVSLFFLI